MQQVLLRLGLSSCLFFPLVHGSRQPVESDVDAFLERIDSLFRNARMANGSAFLQGLAHPELTIGMVTSPNIEEQYAAASVENWRSYAKLHGYRLEVAKSPEEACGKELLGQLQGAVGEKAAIWAKICMLRRLLQRPPAAHERESFVLVVDADTFVQQPGFSVVDSLAHGLLGQHREASGFMFDDRVAPNDYPGCWGQGGGMNGLCRPNSFLMLFRRGPKAEQFARRWLDDAVGQCAKVARGHPPTQGVLWHCTLPATARQDPGFLYVHNGVENLYTMYLQKQEIPLVHFQWMKDKDSEGVRSAISRVQMLKQ